jgi:hypothetical protein
MLNARVNTGIHQNLRKKNNSFCRRNLGAPGVELPVVMGSINWKPKSDGGTGIKSFMYA